MLVMMLVMLFPVLGLSLFVWLPAGPATAWYAIGLAVSLALHVAMRRSMRYPVRTGQEGMIGKDALVLQWRGESGWVRCGSERWQAETPARDAVRPGARVRVISVDRLTLVVEPVPSRPDRAARVAAGGER